MGVIVDSKLFALIEEAKTGIYVMIAYCYATNIKVIIDKYKERINI